MNRSRFTPWTLAFAALFAVVLTAGGAWAQDKPATKYPFALPPGVIYERLVEAKLGPEDSTPAADRKRLADFWTARTDKPVKDVPQADDDAVVLHLLAAGVTDPNERAGYLKRFNDLVADAKAATGGAKTAGEKADALLRFLHAGPMARGYAARETTLSRLFDTGKYNCVSASSLYFLVGSRLGLVLQPVLIDGDGDSDGHATVDLIEGTKRTQIEATTADGFDWAAKTKRPGRPSGRERAGDWDGFGLAAATAFNRACRAEGAAAVRHLLVALALSPTNSTMGRFTRVVVVEWALAHVRAGRDEEAIRVFAFGRAALGPSDTSEQLYLATWTRHLESVFGTGRVREGSRLLRRAAAAFPDERTFSDPAGFVRRAAENEVVERGWDAGLSFADRALEDLTGDDAKNVRAWKSRARRMWSEQLLRKGGADQSLAVLADGLAGSPADAELLAGLTVHAQMALAYLDAKEGIDAAVAHFRALRKRFPNHTAITEAGVRHAARAAHAACDKKDYADALKRATVYAPLAGDLADELKALVYHRWGRSYAADGDWHAALAKYLAGLEAVPESRLLNESAIDLIDDWASESVDVKDWAGAIAAYEEGLEHFPDSTVLKNGRDFCKKQQKLK